MFTQVDTALERAVTGLGIGLTLVKTLTQMHGGTVDVTSAGIGQGSEFIVRLPIMVETATMPMPAMTREPALTAKALRILIVDDNQDAAGMLAMLLQLSGHETHTAHDGVEAVEATTTLQPDVILLDIGLPRLNGYEAARKIREQQGQPGRPLLVALTGWEQTFLVLLSPHLRLALNRAPTVPKLFQTTRPRKVLFQAVLKVVWLRRSEPDADAG